MEIVVCVKRVPQTQEVDLEIDGGGKDVFLHISALQTAGIAAPDEGAKVSFDTEPDRRGKGPQAIDVQLGE